MTRPTRTPSGPLRLVLAVTVLALALTACAGGDDVSVDPAAPSGSATASGGTGGSGGTAGAGGGTAAGTPARGPADTDGRWTLVSGTGPGGPLRLVDGFPVTLVVARDRVEGKAACNSYGGPVRREGAGFVPGDVAHTEMACVDAGVMDLESAYLGALAAVRTAARDGDRLLLRGEGVELVLAPTPPVPDAAVERTTWTLAGLVDGATTSSPVGEAFLTLDGAGGLTGKAGCREVRGRYTLTGDRLVVTGLTLVEPAAADCGPGPRAQDDAVAAVLREPMTVAVDGRRLTVRAGGRGLDLTSTGTD